MIGDLLNEHYHHNISLYDLLLCIQSLHVLMYGFITYFAVDNFKGNMGNFIPYTPSPSRHMEPCLILTPVTTSVTLFQISPQCPTSRCSSLLAAAALSEPPSVTELPSVGGGVQYQLYSCTVVQCTVYSGHPVQLSAHGPLLSGARLVTPPGPQRKSPFILGLVLQPPPPTASLLHYHIILLAGART